MTGIVNDHEDLEGHGRQLIYAIGIGGRGRNLCSSRMGSYSQILKDMNPKPEVAILRALATANLNGCPYQRSNVQFLVEEVQWLHNRIRYRSQEYLGLI